MAASVDFMTVHIVNNKCVEVLLLTLKFWLMLTVEPRSRWLVVRVGCAA